MAGCNAQITVYVERGFSYREHKTRCGSTGVDGYPQFCDKCEKKYNNVNWKQEARDNGEAWDETER